MDVEHAILNNATWCAAVVGAHGVPSEIGEHYWWADGAVPLYYSNLVTRTREEGERAQLERIRALAAAPPKPRWGIKDSYARLDRSELEALGLRELFEANWYGLEAGTIEAAEPETDARIVRVESPDELAMWEKAWQVSSPAPGVRIFPPVLLQDPDIAFLAAMRGTSLVGGAIANLCPNAVGLSNVFTLDSELSVPLLRDSARIVRELHPDRAIVGYGRPSELRILQALGFKNLGQLRVWVT
jgi:hypothetical protein